MIQGQQLSNSFITLMALSIADKHHSIQHHCLTYKGKISKMSAALND